MIKTKRNKRYTCNSQIIITTTDFYLLIDQNLLSLLTELFSYYIFCFWVCLKWVIKSYCQLLWPGFNITEIAKNIVYDIVLT